MKFFQKPSTVASPVSTVKPSIAQRTKSVLLCCCVVVLCVVVLCVVCCCVLCVVVVVVVEWLYYSKRIIIVRKADLSEFFPLIFVGKMCLFVSRPMKIVTFPRKNGDPAKRVVDFPLERDTFRNKIMEIVEDLTCESKSLHFSFFFHRFSSFFSFFFFFKNFFSIFHFLSFSPFSVFFIFFNFLEFSLLGAQNLIFFRASLSLRFLFTVLLKKFNFSASLFVSSFFFFFFFFLDLVLLFFPFSFFSYKKGSLVFVFQH